MVSYAQNFEDVLLRRAFFGQDRGFYIDVGAADPYYDSVTQWFYDHGWSGINIDPVRAFYDRLVSCRPRDTNILAAVGRKREYSSFFEVENLSLSTCDESVAMMAKGLGYSMIKRETEVRTLRDIFDEFRPASIDFLKIDAEGWEAEIIAGADWKRYRPRVVIIEATEPNTQRPSHRAWEGGLLEAGYLFAWFDGVNRYYVPTEEKGLADRLSTPPNYFDNFKLARELVLEERATAADLQVKALTQQVSETNRQVTDQIKVLEERVTAADLQVNALTQQVSETNRQATDQINVLQTELERRRTRDESLSRELDAVGDEDSSLAARLDARSRALDGAVKSLDAARARIRDLHERSLEIDKHRLVRVLKACRLWR
jgi:FkbM family methyltransferase